MVGPLIETGIELSGWIALVGIASSLGIPGLIINVIARGLDVMCELVQPRKPPEQPVRCNHPPETAQPPQRLENPLPIETYEEPEEIDIHQACKEEAHRLKIAQRLAEQELTVLRPKLAGLELEDKELAELRSQVRALQERLQTTEDIPEGRLLIRGRLIIGDKHLAIVPLKGRPFKVLKTTGWDYAGEQGDMVLLEALMQEQGWTVWKVIVEQAASSLEPLDKNLVEKLSASKQKKRTPNFDELDLEAAQNPTRTASHSKTAITLHIVLPTHARFSLTEAQAEDLKQIVTELVPELDMGIISALEIGHTEGGNQRDHLHLLVSAFNHTGDGIGKQIGRLKALSSGRLRRKHPDLREKLWSASYWVSSAGGGLDKVIDYIQGNEFKHKGED